jgi:hypothetical protein
MVILAAANRFGFGDRISIFFSGKYHGKSLKIKFKSELLV